MPGPPSSLSTSLRTHTCGELREGHVGETVSLCGWVANYRDHGGVVFIDLRDRFGLTQLVFDPDAGEKLSGDGLNAATHELARGLRGEDVVRVTGAVHARGEGLRNPKLATGGIEVRASALTVLNKSATPPFEPGAEQLPGEELRLKHRYLDLRRPKLQRTMELRHRLSKITRDYFDGLGFLEVETPILGRSTPEGARDYLVPSRVHPGEFYALPQSPQLYKQILMVGGTDRYFQIARCFRDEDLRSDRQPEFSQVDVEMSFVEREDVLTTIDGLIAAYAKELRGKEISLPLPRLTHAEALDRFGSDKPDTRFGLELKDISDVAAECEFGVFNKTVAGGGKVRGLCAPDAAAKYSRKDLDGLTAFVGEWGAKGLAWFRVVEEEGAMKLQAPTAKFFTAEQQSAIIERLSAKPGDLALFVADKPSVVNAALANLRNRLGRELALYDPSELAALWVLEFPLVGRNEEENRWEAEHHPFCAVHPEDVEKLKSDPAAVRAESYDLVCNGYEAASGSVRIHDPAVQQTVFDLIGMDSEEAGRRFGFLLDALKYGAPPHAGIALGLDRWVMILAQLENIRDVIAFPKTQKAADLMTGAPGDVDGKQLEELHIRTVAPPK
ncbi:aspartate--tRNA ligase [Alienimonas californiensis]|uniref:Aspartate--tRNA(Asp/Asn) ligase n=1 Tax=Alienimonas californiensis TaxID=2527989 RepID=A0A517PFB5_9PLAN|nr:aspartate--tRNA ligase [Alienimonas californiensis]QDT18055.1 Aspartate--tRNA ligase [Alienimonas californiensis]